MDTIPGDDPMDNPAPLSGLDPADLLRQGAAEDTLVDGIPPSFHPPTLEEMAELFPRFEILELIGQGGMGAVYKVRQMDLDRVVALKILPPGISGTAGFSERFTLEAKALAKLNHPGIVTIHEFGQTSSSPVPTSDTQPLYHILMEFVDGVNLGQLMRGGRIAPLEALAIVPQICDALQFAHDRGIVHRDIKPENILIDRHGRVKVADFGIAKVVAAVCDPSVVSVCDRRSSDPSQRRSQTAATVPGKIMGTPQYMAPEQMDRPSEVDHRADIYALGVVFYQMLTGELPGKDLQAPSRKVSIDVRLDEIVMQALERNPELRYQQASQLRTKVETMDKTESASVDRSGSRFRIITGILLILFLPLALWVAFDQRSRQAVEHVEDHIFTIPPNISMEEARAILTKAMGAFHDVTLSHLPDGGQWRLSSVGPSQDKVRSRLNEAVAAVRHDLTLNRKRILSEPIIHEQSRSTSSQIFPWNADSGFLAKLKIYLIVGIICATLGFFCLLPPRGRRSNGWIATGLIVWLGIAGGAVYQLRPGQISGFEPWLTIDVPAMDGTGEAVSELDEVVFDGRDEMDAAVGDWLEMIDGGNPSGAWDDMSEIAKSLHGESDWEAMLKTNRVPLGAVVNRKWAETREASHLGGFSNFSNRVYQYRTDFEHGKAVETVVLVLEESGDLRVMSYVIEPETETSSLPVPAMKAAESFVKLDLARAEAREMYLEGDPERVRLEGQWNAFIEEHPDFPNEKSREIVIQQRIELLREINGLAKDLGTGNPKIVALELEMKRLADLPEMGEIQFERETTAKILARDLPANNRLEVRLVTPDEATAETVKPGDDNSREIRVSREVIVCDRFIRQISFQRENSSDANGTIHFKLDEVGTKRMADATGTGHGMTRLAILVDGKLESAPVVQAQLGSDFLLPVQRSPKEYVEFLKSLPIASENVNSVEAIAWLIEADKGNFSAGYSETTIGVRKRFSPEEWVKVMGRIRESTGKEFDRRQGTYHETVMWTGDKKASFRLFTFKSKFSNKLNAVETVSMLEEEDGTWKVDGYWVR